MAGEGVGEGVAVFDGGGDGGEGIFHRAGAVLLLEDFQGADDGQAGVLEGGELLGEIGEGAGGDAAEGEAFDGRGGGGCGGSPPPALCIHPAGQRFLRRASLMLVGKWPLVLIWLRASCWVGGFDMGVDGLAGGVHGAVLEQGHGRTSSGRRLVAAR